MKILRSFRIFLFILSTRSVNFTLFMKISLQGHSRRFARAGGENDGQGWHKFQRKDWKYDRKATAVEEKKQVASSSQILHCHRLLFSMKRLVFFYRTATSSLEKIAGLLDIRVNRMIKNSEKKKHKNVGLSSHFSMYDRVSRHRTFQIPPGNILNKKQTAFCRNWEKKKRLQILRMREKEEKRWKSQNTER